MDGISIRNRSEERISILHILQAQVLHDIIREFARDSVPSIVCDSVRRAVNFYAAYWDVWPIKDEYYNGFLKHAL